MAVVVLTPVVGEQVMGQRRVTPQAGVPSVATTPGEGVWWGAGGGLWVPGGPREGNLAPQKG